eukprot:EG_transcript_38535
MHLATALKDNTSLQSIDLSGNDIGDDGTAFLADALKGNTTLKEINLDQNVIGPEGAVHLNALLKGNTTLHSISLADNVLGSTGAAHVAAALRTNATLQRLEVGGQDDIDDETLQLIADLLQVNGDPVLQRAKLEQLEQLNADSKVGRTQ